MNSHRAIQIQRDSRDSILPPPIDQLGWSLDTRLDAVLGNAQPPLSYCLAPNTTIGSDLARHVNFTSLTPASLSLPVL